MQLVAEAVGEFQAFLCRFIPVLESKAGHTAGGGRQRAWK